MLCQVKKQQIKVKYRIWGPIKTWHVSNFFLQKITPPYCPSQGKTNANIHISIVNCHMLGNWQNCTCKPVQKCIVNAFLAPHHVAFFFKFFYVKSRFFNVRICITNLKHCTVEPRKCDCKEYTFGKRNLIIWGVAQ